MTSITMLWLPILVSAAGVFVASSIIHMVFKYHSSDFAGVTNEEGVRSALTPFAIPPGDYVVPYAGTMEAMKSPEYTEKVVAGPNIFMTVLPNRVPGMGGQLFQWFLFSLLISVFAGYIARISLGPDAHYLMVFRVVGAAAFMGYGFAYLPGSIWYKKKWSTTLKSVFDGLVYALITAGVFGWLWPV